MQEIGHEEAIHRRAGYWFSTGSGCGPAGQGAMPIAWFLRSALLPMAQQIRWHERVRCQATEGSGSREFQTEEVVSRIAA